MILISPAARSKEIDIWRPGIIWLIRRKEKKTKIYPVRAYIYSPSFFFFFF